MTAAIVLLVAWGVGAFGAVYPWAYGPLLLGAAAVGLWGVTRTPRLGREPRALWAAFAAVAAAILLQLLPLPRGILESLSPELDHVLGQYSLEYANSTGPHALSIHSGKTILGLGFFVCLWLFLAGTMRHITRRGPADVVVGIMAIGFAVALIGIVQRVTVTNGQIYGFWTPRFQGDFFGPFVNKNHFAGWMLMAVPLGLGELIGRLATVMHQVKAGWRNRVAWMSSPEANSVVFVAAATTVMALSLLLTLSRSGIAALAATAVLSLGAIFAAPMRRSRQALAGTGILLIAYVALSWTDVAGLAAHFSGTSNSVPVRVAIWRDTVRIWSLFSLTGTGINTFGVATLFYQTVPVPLHFVEAHNDYLQIAAEGGLLVGIPAAIAIVVFGREVWRSLREEHDSARTFWIRIGAVLGIVAVAFQEMVDFSLQMPGNAVLFTVLCAIAIHQRRDNHARTSR